MDLFDRSIFDIINDRAKALENRLSADVVFYHGRIHPAYFRGFRDFIEELKDKSTRQDNAVAVFIRTKDNSHQRMLSC